MTRTLWTQPIGCVIPLPTHRASQFVLLSYMVEMALNATRKNRARKEATLKELKVYARLFIRRSLQRLSLGSTMTFLTLLISGSSNRRTLSQVDGF